MARKEGSYKNEFYTQRWRINKWVQFSSISFIRASPATLSVRPPVCPAVNNTSSHHLHPFICSRSAAKRKRECRMKSKGEMWEKDNKGNGGAAGMRAQNWRWIKANNQRLAPRFLYRLQRASLTWKVLSPLLWQACRGPLRFVSSALLRRRHAAAWRHQSARNVSSMCFMASWLGSRRGK